MGPALSETFVQTLSFLSDEPSSVADAPATTMLDVDEALEEPVETTDVQTGDEPARIKLPTSIFY